MSSRLVLHFERATVVLLLLSVGACSSVPDISPYVNATKELESEWSKGMDAVATELKQTGPTHVKSFHQVQKDYEESLQSLVVYSESMQAITDSGNTGEEAAKGLTSAVNGLANTVGVPVIPANIAAAGEAAYKIIARELAANKLEETLVRSQKVIDDCTQRLRADLQPLQEVFILASADSESKLDIEYSNQLAYRNNVIEAINREYAQGFDASRAEQSQRVLEIARQFDAMSPWYADYTARRNSILERREAGLRIFTSIERSLAVWGREHAKVVDAIIQERGVHPADLIRAINDLEELRESVGAL